MRGERGEGLVHEGGDMMCTIYIPHPISEWLSSGWDKITDIVVVTADPLSNLFFLSDRLSLLATQELLSKDLLCSMWMSLAKRFSSFVSKVSGCGMVG